MEHILCFATGQSCKSPVVFSVRTSCHVRNIPLNNLPGLKEASLCVDAEELVGVVVDGTCPVIERGGVLRDLLCAFTCPVHRPRYSDMQ